MNHANPTSVETELAEQRRWHLRAQLSGSKIPERLVVNEFASPDEHRARQGQALAAQVRFAASAVPYYRERFRRLGIEPESIRDLDGLRRLAVLRKASVQDFGGELRAQSLPPGEAYGGPYMTSGTTGKQLTVHHSQTSVLMNFMQSQRGARWFRQDPSRKMAAILPPRDLPRQADGKPHSRGTTVTQGHWPAIGEVFETGPFVGVAPARGPDELLDWLDEQAPAYLRAHAARLEQLAFACDDRAGPPVLASVTAISQTLTDSMRERIAESMRTRVNVLYGLNEIGPAAAMCPEGGRYHVFTETCLIELVDEAGEPCAPGEVGRLLVTSLANRVMPLLRYDTGDLAEAVAGACPCGRTLPAFGLVRGRYRRLAFLPPETWPHWGALQAALRRLPVSLSRSLREYQLHQYADRSCELRLVVTGAIDPALAEWLTRAWERADAVAPLALRIVRVDEVACAPSGKIDNFTSDLAPGLDATLRDEQPESG